MTAEIETPAQRPFMRGRLHEWGFFMSLPMGVALVATAAGAMSKFAAIVYAASLAALFGTSALYHRITWSPRARAVMRRLDHSMIFVLIAGTYTPVCLLALPGAWGWSLLIAVWTGALIGITLKVAGLERYRKVSAPLYIVLGWLAVVATPQLLDRPDLLALALVGGLFYTVGAVLFAMQWPGRVATWFGYHEWWHTFTLLAGVCFFAMNAWLIASA